MTLLLFCPSVALGQTFSAVPPSLTFTAFAGGPAPPAQNLTITSTNPNSGVAVAVIGLKGCSWLNVPIGASGRTPFTLNLIANPATTPGLGTFTCVMNFSVAVGPVTVTLNVIPPPPTLTSIGPNNAAPGASVPVTITGTNFINVTGVSSSVGGLAISSLVTVSAVQINATFAVSPNTACTSASIQVTTASGTSNSVAFTINCAAPTLTSISPASGTQGSSVGVTLTGTNFFSVSGITTPPGISVSNFSVVSPNAITATFNIGPAANSGSVSVRTSGGTSNPQAFTVTSATTLSASPNAITFSYAIGGAIPSPQTVAVTSNIPASGVLVIATPSPASCSNWLTFQNAASTPYVMNVGLNAAGLGSLAVGSYACTLTLTGGAAIATIPVSLFIKPPGLTIDCSLAAGPVEVTLQYSASCTASSGSPPYNWSIGSGSMPAGLALSATTGLSIAISGKPTVGGAYSYSIEVTDGASHTASQAYSGVVLAAPSITGPLSLSSGTEGVAYTNVTFASSGGSGENSWSAAGLPNGLNFSSAGVLSGTPATGSTGNYSVQVTVTDFNRVSGTVRLALTIAPKLPTINNSSLPSGTQNQAYPSETLQALGGQAPYTWTAVGLPNGMTLSSTGVLSGKPTVVGNFQVTFTVIDSNMRTASKVVTLAVAPPALQGITIVQSTAGAASNQANLQVGTAQPADSTLSGTLQLSFVPDPNVTNVPSNYIDPAGGFPAGPNSTQLTSTFTINQGATNISVPFAEGTVAGAWTATLTGLNSSGFSVLPTPSPFVTVTVPVAAPAVGSAKIVNATSTGFVVQISGYATSRTISSATFVFTAAAGATLQGATVTIPFNGLDQSQWFNTDPGRSAGGTFSLELPFAYNGDPAALGSVAVTLSK